MPFHAWLAVLLLVACPLACSAADVSLLASPGPSQSFLYVAPVHHNGSLFGPVGGELPSDPKRGVTRKADWYIAQWNNPLPFDSGNLPVPGRRPRGPPNPNCNASAATPRGMQLEPAWSIESDTSRVCALRAVNSSSSGDDYFVQLAANGSNRLQCGEEFDMFLSPLDGVYDYKPANFKLSPVHEVNGRSTLLPLANMTKLRLVTEMTLNYAGVQQRCGTFPQCGPTPDYGYLTIAVPIHNDVAGQQNFFQIAVFDTRSNQCGSGRYDACQTDGSISYYFTKLPTLGCNVNLGYLQDGACIRQGGDSVIVDVDLLPVLRRVVAQGAADYGADGHLGNWFVSGYYAGLGLQGATSMTITVGGISITAET